MVKAMAMFSLSANGDRRDPPTHAGTCEFSDFGLQGAKRVQTKSCPFTLPKLCPFTLPLRFASRTIGKTDWSVSLANGRRMSYIMTDQSVIDSDANALVQLGAVVRSGRKQIGEGTNGESETSETRASRQQCARRPCALSPDIGAGSRHPRYCRAQGPSAQSSAQHGGPPA
jgi:hypothetical protein